MRNNRIIWGVLMLFFGCSDQNIIESPNGEPVKTVSGKNAYEQNILFETKNGVSHLSLNLKNSISHYFGKGKRINKDSYMFIPKQIINYGLQKKYSHSSDSAYIYSNFSSKKQISPIVYMNDKKYLIENGVMAFFTIDKLVEINIVSNYLDYKIKDSLIFDIESSSIVFDDKLYCDSIFIVEKSKEINVKFYKKGEINYSGKFSSL